jgi:hypothetical protein
MVSKMVGKEELQAKEKRQASERSTAIYQLSLYKKNSRWETYYETCRCT